MRSLILATLLLAASTTAHAQFPGGRMVNADNVRGEFLLRMQMELAGFLRSWDSTFHRDARVQPQTLYLKSAVVLPPRGSFITGEPVVRDWLQSVRDSVRDASTSMMDHDASDAIAFVYSPYSFSSRDGSGTLNGGVQLSVLFKERLDWQVRAQLFMPSDSTRALPLPTTQPLPIYQLPRDADGPTRMRYDRAVATFAALRSGWAEGRVPAALISNDLLLRLPGEETALKGDSTRSHLDGNVKQFGQLQVATVDFAARGRLAYLMGRYYVATPRGPRTGNFIVILADEDNVERVRALLFT
jgi:hypothetical protein